MTAPVRFMQHYVTNGTAKAKVHYSLGKHYDGRTCVTLYAQGYSRALGKVLPNEYENKTEIETDYFDEGKVDLFEDHPLYAAARARAELNQAKRADYYAKLEQRRKARREARAMAI